MECNSRWKSIKLKEAQIFLVSQF